MATPAGYTSQRMIFHDQFSGNSLDTSKWVTYLGAQGGVWNDFGRFPPGDSGGNSPPTNNIEWYRPSQVSVNNGLALTAQPDNTYAGACSGSGGPPCGRTWVSGVVSTEGKFQLPAASWYVQVSAQMPDTSAGMWPAIWFMPDTSLSPTNEFDGHEGGATGSNWPINQNGATGYFANSGHQETYWNAGFDLSAGYHVYGFHYDSNAHTITTYFDGTQEAVNTNVTNGTYEIILQLQVAGPQTSGWHTTGGTTPATMKVAEVQAYANS
jgi:hypothetical protein